MCIQCLIICSKRKAITLCLKNVFSLVSFCWKKTVQFIHQPYQNIFCVCGRLCGKDYHPLTEQPAGSSFTGLKESVRSRGQRPYWFIKTKEKFCINRVQFPKYGFTPPTMPPLLCFSPPTAPL